MCESHFIIFTRSDMNLNHVRRQPRRSLQPTVPAALLWSGLVGVVKTNGATLPFINAPILPSMMPSDAPLNKLKSGFTNSRMASQVTRPEHRWTFTWACGAQRAERIPSSTIAQRRVFLSSSFFHDKLGQYLTTNSSVQLCGQANQEGPKLLYKQRFEMLVLSHLQGDQ